MKFKGDIIITDPCYVDTEDNKWWDGHDVDIFSGAGIHKHGFTSYIWDNTIYGDWSCSVFKLKDEAKDKPTSQLTLEDVDSVIGSFCADAGLVAIFLLDEVMRFNPTFDYHKERTWTTALIEGFDGDIEYEVINDEVFIRGRGNINFVTRQTGL